MIFNINSNCSLFDISYFKSGEFPNCDTSKDKIKHIKLTQTIFEIEDGLIKIESFVVKDKYTMWLSKNI